MITINLLPPEYKRKKRTAGPVPYIPLVILFGVLFFLLTLFFFADYLKTKSAYDRIWKEWEQISPQMQQLKSLERKVDVEMRGEKEFLEKYVLNTDSMTRILECLSENLPPSAWLTEVRLERVKGGGKLALQGVVLPMLKKTGIEQIEDYMKKLKENLPKGNYTLTTAKQDSKGSGEGIAFSALFDWGAENT